MYDLHGRFAWYELVTTDVQAAMTFYTKVMGWRALDASVSGRAYTLFSAGNVFVAGLLNLPEDAAKIGGNPSWLGYVAVSDVDASAERVRRLGGAVHVPPTDVPDISRYAIFTDPQAARLALIKWLTRGPERPAAPDAPGRVGWHELLAADEEKALSFYSELFGWQKGDADTGGMGRYQLFSVAGETIGGMLTKPATISSPFWLYYFNTDDLDAAAGRVQAGGGQVLGGPFQVPGGSGIVQCIDPQGAMFALEGQRGHKAVGYFERIPSRDGVPGRPWSW